MSPRPALIAACALVPALAFAALRGPPIGRMHPEFKARMAGVHTVGVVAPSLRYFETTPLLRSFERPDWGDAAAEDFVQALAAELHTRGLRARRFDPAWPEGRDQLASVKLLYGLVDNAVEEALDDARFPRKAASFEYTVGDLHPLLDGSDVDALLLMRGVVTDLVGKGRPGGESEVRRGTGNFSLALVDRSGAVLWYSSGLVESHNIRHPHAVARIIDALVATLPGGAR